MNPFVQPHRGPAGQVIEPDNDVVVGFEFGQERLLQLTERPLDLALAFGVTGLARRDLHTVMGGEPDRWRVQVEPSAL